MSVKKSFLFCVATVLMASHAQAQIDAPRRIDWSRAGAAGGVQARTSICSTLNPGATASQINSAIASCAAGQVVFLNAGTYNLSTGIVFDGKSGVTLRGAGPDKTFLKFSGSDGCIGLNADICAKNSNGINPSNPAGSTAWTGGFAKGSTSITLASTAGLSVGSIILLDQLNDSNSDNGQIWQCENVNVCATEGPSGLSRDSRSQVQPVVITSISGTTVGLASPVYMPNYRSSQSPGAWWASTPISGVGIEDLSLDHANSSGAYAGIFFSYARDSWVRNIRSLNSNRAHIWFYGSTRSTVRDSYFYGTLNALSQSYGIETDMTSDLLVENNIFQHVTAGMPTGEATAGSVYGYNYSIDDYYTLASWMQASSYHHSAGINYTLFEGNDGIGFTADAIHGTSHFMTAFRNYWVGWETGKTQQSNAVNVYAFNRYYNFVGNVLGRSGFHTTYECSAATGSTSSCTTGISTSIFMLGWSGNEERFSSVPNDPLVKTTILRWGNYDVISGSRFNASEVPSGLSAYGNAVPSGTALPASLYLSGRPGWWGTAPFPAIGPDVSGGALMSGHVNKIAARVCYENTAKVSGILTFNANACYGTTTSTQPPAAPSNLRIIR